MLVVLVFELSYLALLFGIVFLCVKKLFDSFGLEFVELFFLFFHLAVEFDFLHFEWVYFLVQLLKTFGLKRDLLFKFLLLFCFFLQISHLVLKGNNLGLFFIVVLRVKVVFPWSKYFFSFFFKLSDFLMVFLFHLLDQFVLKVHLVFVDVRIKGLTILDVLFEVLYFSV